MAVYTRFIKTALRLIKKYGQIVDWTIPLKQNDNTQPWLKLDGLPEIKKPSIAFFTVDKEMKETFRYGEGFRDVAEGSLIGYMGAVDFEPSLNDSVFRNGKTLQIKNIDCLNVNGEIVLYTIEFAG
jgi:hypothetical protein